MKLREVGILYFLILQILSVFSHGIPFRIGDKVEIQCKDQNGEWGPGPICVDTNEPLTFKYGVDGMTSCSWSLRTEEEYEHFRRLISREENWECRVPMQRKIQFFVPFFIPIWGVLEPTHLHLDNHLNFLFHALSGRILGAAAYPIRDNFVVGKKGSLVHIHGPVKWFRGGTFFPYSGSRGFDSLRDSCIPLVFGWSLFSSLITASICFAIYQWYLYPNLKRRFSRIKKEQ